MTFLRLIGTVVIVAVPITGQIKKDSSPSYVHIQDASKVLALDFAEGAGSTTQDRSGNSNDGKIRGATWTSGKYGSALSFDGDDDYLDIPDSPSLEPAGPFSVAFWLKTSQTGNKVILEKDGNDGFSVQRRGTNTLKMNVGLGNEIISAGTYNDGRWHFVVLVYRGPNNGSIYVDGVDDTGVSKPGTPTFGDGSLYIGSRAGRVGFQGSLDEIAIYNRALSASDIADMHSAHASNN